MRTATSVDQRTYSRGSLADTLLAQQKRWVCCEAQRQNVEALRESGTLAVVTGQQLGVFCGPVYTLYKAQTAIKLARRLEENLGCRVVPVFWLEGADHDLVEVSSARIVSRDAVTAVEYRGHVLGERGNLGAVGVLRFTADIERVCQEMLGSLPPSDFRDMIQRDFVAPYRKGATFVDAFALCLSRLFGSQGLVLMDPEEQSLKQLAAPLFLKELSEYDASHSRIRSASEALQAEFHAQVRPRATNLFRTDESGGRQAILPHGAGFILRDSGRRMEKDELMQHPEKLSPNVALRPVVQDMLLPTVAYVAGPGEVSYFAQLRGLYEWAGVPMPIVYPRASVTVIGSRMQKALDKLDLAVEDFGGDTEQLFAQIVDRKSGIREMFADASTPAIEAVNSLLPHVIAVDPTLQGTVAATRTHILKEFDRLKRRVLKAEKRKRDALRSTLVRAKAQLFPNGALQERALSSVYFFSRYGPAFQETLTRALSLDSSKHQVISI